MKKVWMLLLMLSAAVALADTRHSAIGQTPQMSPSDLFLIMTNGAGGPRTKQITASNALESLKSFSNWTGGSGGGGTLTNFAAGSNAVLYVDQGTNIFAAKTDTNAVQFVATNAGALLWYPLANPAGYINGSALNAYALIASLGTSAYSNANSFVLSSSGVATNLLVYSIPGGTISFKRNSSGNTVLFSIDNDTGNVRGKGNLYGFNGSDGSFFFAGSTITGDATQLVAPLFTGNGFGLTNLNSAIATNAAGAPDGYVFVKSGDKIKLIQITGGGDLLAANNLSDLASPAQGLINLGGVPSARAVNTSSPLLGGGSLNGNLSLSIQNAQADGSTKGAATFAAADFDSTVGGLISIDYANGQKATTSLPGFLTSADWNTFNNKAAAGLALTNNEARNVTLLGNLTTTNTTDTFNISPFLSQFFIGSNYWGFSMTNGTSIAWTNGVLTQSGGTNTSWLSNLVVTGWTSLRGAETNTTLTGPGVVAADANGGRSIATIGTGLSLAAGVLSATGGGSGGFVTPFNNNQFGSAGGTTNIKSGATLTNINFYGPLVWATNAQSQKLDWAVGAPPVQGIITNASFDFDFLNGPPGVGSSATFSISNSAATSITVTFINTTAGAYSIQAGAAVSSVSVAAGAVMVQNWFYNGLNYYVDYSTKAGSGGTVTSVGVDATGTGLVVISTPVTTSGTINLRSGAPIVTNNFASSMLFSNAVKIDAASALSISNVVAGSLLKVNAGNQVAAAVAGDVPDLSSLYISRNAGSGTNVTIKGNADGTNALWVGPTGVVISNALGTVTIKGGNQTNSQNIEAASLDIIGAMTGARGGFGAAADATLKLLVEADGLGTTANNGIYLKNATAAAAGAQQYSPGTTYEAQGWKTASTAASQSVKFFEGVVPVQGTANPSGFLVYSNSINGGTWTEVLRISSAGDLTAPSLNTPGNLSVSGSAGITGLLSATAGIASGAAIDVASGAVTLGADGSVTFTGAATGSGSGLTGIPESGVSSLTSDLAARVTASGGTLTANDIILGAGTKDVKRVAGISSDGTSKIIVGVAGTSVGSIEFKNATSGSVIVSPPTGALGTINVTWPNASSTLPIFGQQITFSGPTAARTITLPDAAFTAARTDAGQTFTGTQNITTIDLGNTDTTLTRSAAGVMAVEGHDVLTTDGTQTVQNKTIDSANNVIKLKGYIQLKNFDNITGAKPNNTNDYTVSTFMKPVFLNGTAATANFIQFEIQVPTDFDTAVDPKIKITDKLTAADTGVRRYVVSTISPAASAAYDGTVGTAINVDIAADASGASGDVEQSSQTTLTGWGAALTPGRHWIIQIGRDGNSGTDTSTVDSMFSVAEIEYGVSQ